MMFGLDSNCPKRWDWFSNPWYWFSHSSFFSNLYHYSYTFPTYPPPTTTTFTNSHTPQSCWSIALLSVQALAYPSRKAIACHNTSFGALDVIRQSPIITPLQSPLEVCDMIVMVAMLIIASMAVLVIGQLPLFCLLVFVLSRCRFGRPGHYWFGWSQWAFCWRSSSKCGCLSTVAQRWSLSLSTTGVAKEQKENCQVNDNQPSYFDFRTAKKLANNGSRRNDDMGAQ